MKNYRLYFFELLFALLLIFAHVSFPKGELYFDSFGRITVVFFFILSGYYYTKTIKKVDYTYKITLKKCLRLFLMMLSTVVVYFVVFIPANWINLGTPKLFTEPFNIDNLWVFARTYFPKHTFLWFITSLILCYLVYPYLYKIKWFKENKFSIIVPLILLLSIYVYRIFCNQYKWGFFSSYYITRNFLLTGLPCFLIGSYIFHHEKDFKRINPLPFYIVLVLLFATTMLEAFYHELTSNKPNEFYLSSIAIAILVFIYCIQKPEFKFGEYCFRLLGSTGPTIIYLYHLFFAMILGSLYNIRWGVFLLIVCADICAILLGLICNLFKVKVLNKERVI